MKPRRPPVGNDHQAEQPERQLRGLLTVRSAVILLFASLAAIGAGCLLYAAHHSFALAVLGGAAAFAAAVPFFNSVID
jgi:hypothetical protein